MVYVLMSFSHVTILLLKPQEKSQPSPSRKKILYTPLPKDSLHTIRPTETNLLLIPVS